MKTTLYFNQYSNGGAIDREKWELFKAPIMIYGDCETLKTVTIELPENWTVKKNGYGEEMIFDSTGYPVTLENNYFEIYAISAELPKGKRLKLREIIK